MNLKKISLFPVVLILAAGLVLPAPAGAVEVKIKLYGGYSYLIGGDLNKGTGGMPDFWSELFTLAGASKSGAFKGAHAGPSFGGDLVLMFSPVIGIGFGSEYLKASDHPTIVFTKGSDTVQILPKAEASAVPLNLSLYFCFSGGPGFRVNLYAGVGYYMAKMLSSWRLQEGSDFIQIESTAKANDIGFHGGLGFEFDLSPNVALFIEARGRYAKLGGFEGDANLTASGGSDHVSGKLYYWEAQGVLTAFYPMIQVASTAPVPSSTTRNVREAKVDFSGGTALGGIVFKF